MLTIPVCKAILLHNAITFHRKVMNGTTAPVGIQEHNLDYDFWLSYCARKHDVTVGVIEAVNRLAIFYDYFVGSLARYQQGEYPLSMLKNDQKELLRLLLEYETQFISVKSFIDITGDTHMVE